MILKRVLLAVLLDRGLYNMLYTPSHSRQTPQMMVSVWPFPRGSNGDYGCVFKIGLCLWRFRLHGLLEVSFGSQTHQCRREALGSSSHLFTNRFLFYLLSCLPAHAYAACSCSLWSQFSRSLHPNACCNHPNAVGLSRGSTDPFRVLTARRSAPTPIESRTPRSSWTTRTPRSTCRKPGCTKIA